MEPVGAVFPALSAVLVSAERTGHVHPVGQIHPYAARIQLLADPVRFFQIFREDIGAQPEGRYCLQLRLLLLWFLYFSTESTGPKTSS